MLWSAVKCNHKKVCALPRHAALAQKFQNWNGLTVVEDQNALSTTNRKPPKNLFDKFSNTITSN